MKLALVLKHVFSVFFGRSVELDWKPGSEGILRMPNGRVNVKGRACALADLKNNLEGKPNE